MKRIIISLAAGLSCGTAIGFAFGIFIYPFWFLNDIATEMLPASETRIIAASGTFTDVNASDPVHWGKGDVTIYSDESDRAIIHLEQSFQVGPGPRFHLYLVENQEIKNRDDFETSNKIDLGRLRAFEGSQVYTAPAGITIADYRSVVIWCKEFDVLISPATLAHSRVENAHQTDLASNIWQTEMAGR